MTILDPYGTTHFVYRKVSQIQPSLPVNRHLYVHSTKGHYCLLICNFVLLHSPPPLRCNVPHKLLPEKLLSYKLNSVVDLLFFGLTLLDTLLVRSSPLLFPFTLYTVFCSHLTPYWGIMCISVRNEKSKLLKILWTKVWTVSILTK